MLVVYHLPLPTLNGLSMILGWVPSFFFALSVHSLYMCRVYSYVCIMCSLFIPLKHATSSFIDHVNPRNLFNLSIPFAEHLRIARISREHNVISHIQIPRGMNTVRLCKACAILVLADEQETMHTLPFLHTSSPTYECSH